MGNRSIFLYQSGIVITDGVTQKDNPAHHWMCGFKREGGDSRQIRCPSTPRRDVEAFGPQSGQLHTAKKNL
jgi:hypothetical protein